MPPFVVLVICSAVLHHTPFCHAVTGCAFKWQLFWAAEKRFFFFQRNSEKQIQVLPLCFFCLASHLLLAKWNYFQNNEGSPGWRVHLGRFTARRAAGAERYCIPQIERLDLRRHGELLCSYSLRRSHQVECLQKRLMSRSGLVQC